MATESTEQEKLPDAKPAEEKIGEQLVFFPEEERSISPAVNNKRARHRAKCPVCQHPQAKEIHQKLKQWRAKKLVSEEYGIELNDIQKHCNVFKLDVKKFRNTEYVYEQILEWGLSHFEQLEIKAKDVIHAAERLDKLTGREVKKFEISGPPVINFIKIPAPGGIQGKPKEVTFEGKVVPALPNLTKGEKDEQGK